MGISWLGCRILSSLDRPGCPFAKFSAITVSNEKTEKLKTRKYKVIRKIIATAVKLGRFQRRSLCNLRELPFGALDLRSCLHSVLISAGFGRRETLIDLIINMNNGEQGEMI
jgi:hypothetical protein